MSADFDPYRKWLGIPPKDRPAHHYRLLGIATFEDDPDVIENAADRQMAHVRTFQTGRHSDLSQRILNELAAAKFCLLDGAKKAAYDAALRSELAKSEAPAPPAAVHPLTPPPRRPDAPAEPPIAAPVAAMPLNADRLPVAMPVPGGPAKGVLPPGAGRAPAAPSGGAVAAMTPVPPAPTTTAAAPAAVAASAAVGKGTISAVTRGRARRKQSQFPLAITIIMAVVALALIIVVVNLMRNPSEPKPPLPAQPAPSASGGNFNEKGTQRPAPGPPSESGTRPRPASGQSRPSRPPAGNELLADAEAARELGLGANGKPGEEARGDAAANGDETTSGGAGPSDAALTSPPFSDATAAKRLAVPSENQLREVRLQVRQTYRAETAAAVTPKEKRELAKKIVAAARKEPADSPLAYALLERARETSVENGDAEEAMHVIHEMADRYAIDEMAEKLRSLGDCVGKNRHPDALAAIAREAYLLGERAMPQRRFGEGLAAAQVINRASRISGDHRFIRWSDELVRRATAVVGLQRKAEQSRKTLAEGSEGPAAAAAHLNVGRFACFLEERWTEGLPHLAQSGDSALGELASQELAEATSNEAKLALAEGWLTAARGASVVEQPAMIHRAQHWLRAAQPQARGEAQAKIETLLRESNQLLEENRKAIVPPADAES